MNIYAIAILATKKLSEFVTSAGIRADVRFASNEDEATGKALRLAKETFPPDEGWSSHTVSVEEVEESDMRKLLKLNEGKEQYAGRERRFNKPFRDELSDSCQESREQIVNELFKDVTK